MEEPENADIALKEYLNIWDECRTEVILAINDHLEDDKAVIDTLRKIAREHGLSVNAQWDKTEQLH